MFSKIIIICTVLTSFIFTDMSYGITRSNKKKVEIKGLTKSFKKIGYVSNLNSNSFVTNEKLILKIFYRLNADELDEIFVKSFSGKKLQKRVKKFLPIILKYSYHYRVDPLWAFSIAMVESHFNNKARSYKFAHGLFQLKRSTAVYLRKILKEHIKFDIYNPFINTKLGIFYLSRLKNRFSYKKLATIAYNMGPTWVSKKIRKRTKLGVSNIYLNKVNKVYSILFRKFISISSTNDLDIYKYADL